MQDRRPRFPASVYGGGEDPDPRFSLANERTFLAWITTGLALVSVGVGLEALAGGLQPLLRRAAAIVLILTGIAAPVQAWLGWTSVERALRTQRPLPAPRLAPWLTGAVCLAGLLVLLGVLLA